MQLELTLSAPADPELEEVARLTRYLYEAGDRWVKARQIAAALGVDDRKVRSLASASRGEVVSGPGCPGYKHVRHCDPEEVARVTAQLTRQAKLMADRAGEIRRRFHGV